MLFAYEKHTCCISEHYSQVAKACNSLLALCRSSVFDITNTWCQATCASVTAQLAQSLCEDLLDKTSDRINDQSNHMCCFYKDNCMKDKKRNFRLSLFISYGY